MSGTNISIILVFLFVVQIVHGNNTLCYYCLYCEKLPGNVSVHPCAFSCAKVSFRDPAGNYHYLRGCLTQEKCSTINIPDNFTEYQCNLCDSDLCNSVENHAAPSLLTLLSALLVVLTSTIVMPQ